jgi:hypothetical protein
MLFEAKKNKGKKVIMRVIRHSFLSSTSGKILDSARNYCR